MLLSIFSSFSTRISRLPSSFPCFYMSAWVIWSRSPCTRKISQRLAKWYPPGWPQMASQQMPMARREHLGSPWFPLWPQYGHESWPVLYSFSMFYHPARTCGEWKATFCRWMIFRVELSVGSVGGMVNQIMVISPFWWSPAFLKRFDLNVWRILLLDLHPIFRNDLVWATSNQYQRANFWLFPASYRHVC